MLGKDAHCELRHIPYSLLGVFKDCQPRLSSQPLCLFVLICELWWSKILAPRKGGCKVEGGAGW